MVLNFHFFHRALNPLNYRTDDHLTRGPGSSPPYGPDLVALMAWIESPLWRVGDAR